MPLRPPRSDTPPREMSLMSTRCAARRGTRSTALAPLPAIRS